MSDPTPDNNSSISQGSLRSGNQAGQEQEIPPELVEKVIERVYQLLLKDLAIERERCGYFGGAVGDRSGGW